MAKQPARVLRPAARLSQNYFSLIIALAVFLCLSVSAGFIFASQLFELSERLIIIGFFIVFPVFATGVAIWLILQNIRRIKARENDHLIDWKILSSENQRAKLNAQVKEIASILAVPENQLSDLRSAYIVAGDLAFRRIEDEAKIPLVRHVTIDTAEFDALLIDENVIKCAEIMFLVSPNIPEERIIAILHKIEATKKFLAKVRPGTKIILFFILVTQLDHKGEMKLRSSLADKLAAATVDVDIRLFDFETLQKMYAEG